MKPFADGGGSPPAGTLTSVWAASLSPPFSPGLLDPVFAFLFAVVTGIQSQVSKKREQWLGVLQEWLYPVVIGDVGHMGLCL